MSEASEPAPPSSASVTTGPRGAATAPTGPPPPVFAGTPYTPPVPTAAPTRRGAPRWVLPTVLGSIALLIVGVVAVTLLMALLPADESRALPERDSSGVSSERVEVAETFDTGSEPLPLFTDDGADPAIGLPAPVISGVDPTGNPVTIPVRGPAVIVTLAHWCPHCQREVPILVGMRDTGRWPSTVGLYGISTYVNEERDNYPPSMWLQREGWTDPLLVDTPGMDAVTMYGIRGTPGMVFVDANGIVVLRTSGTISTRAMEILVGQLAAGERPDGSILR